MDNRQHYTTCILRKAIEGYKNYFDFITFEKIISNQNVCVYYRATTMQFTEKCKMQFTGHRLLYSTTSNVATLFTEKSEAINAAFIFFVANLT